MHKSFLIIFVYVLCDALDTDELMNKRQQILRDEALHSLGGNTTLTDKELIVNNCLMQLKFKEIDYEFDNPQYYNFSHHYFSYKEKIRDSKVYQIIKDMPKGAALHVHDRSMLGPDYLLNITYMDDLYVCFNNENDLVLFQFANKTPDVPCNAEWKLMAEVRRLSHNITSFDAELRKQFTMVINDPDFAYSSIKDPWKGLSRYFFTVRPLICYRPIWEQYFYDALKLFREHNIMYIEVRSSLFGLYELNGTVHNNLIAAKICRRIIKRFVEEYPEFVGVKLIYATSRKLRVNASFDEHIVWAKKIKEELPDIFAGFDLVGLEDAGQPLISFLPQLAAAAEDLDYFFHAGETDWYGSLTDCNLVDAILLGAKRLGHAYALPKHPLLMKMVVENDIGLEVNVISNTVLSLVRDVRNHPLSTFIANGLPVVLSSDDPGAWEADPISEDFYIAFIGVASKYSDLKLLKTFALNSLKYSALDAEEKMDAIRRLNLRWNEFVDNFRCSKYTYT